MKAIVGLGLSSGFRTEWPIWAGAVDLLTSEFRVQRFRV